MGFAEQLSFNWPENFWRYLVESENLESFRYYPLLTAVLVIVLVLMFSSFLYAKLNRKNRPLAKFCKAFGKSMLVELLIGLFLLFSRWQVLGFLALRVFLVVWLLSLPVVVLFFGVFYFLKIRDEKTEAAKKADLDKYKP